ncbi:HAD-IA family hydrolase [Marimonas arenosa]|uniref:HAD-IA family hydrolase n=1 Tax=Marimonas arenosa TaxID=1795305 RepID=A0AAE3WG44_9RHOB|nr:HAD-IA family hydrolase [Marimonas arenosa]MDQ2091913.1 HAD-IA family hydrolase [Marimonas arenosa]
MSDLRLAVFDVDGTLADSQGEIVAAMRAAFASENQVPPPRAKILSIVGLSLDRAMAQLARDLDPVRQDRLVAAYKQAYFEQRVRNGASPLYAGALAALERLAQDPFLLLGVATGKSKRGLDALLEAHGLERFFVTRQVADFHPSKPHPAMLQAAFAEAAVGPGQAVMIGDTSFDIEMARAAGCAAIGVAWGYHPIARLDADRVVTDFPALPGTIAEILGAQEENRS